MTSNQRERRAFPRRRLSTPIGIDSGRGFGRAGMTREVSAGGIVFHSRSAYELGEEVNLRFRPPSFETDCRARGRVVRTWQPSGREASLHYVTAVRFHEPLGEELSRRSGDAADGARSSFETRS